MRIITSNDHKVVIDSYEDLTNLLAEYGGRVHGTQHTVLHLEDEEHCYTIVVYFQIPKDSKEEFEKEYGQ